MPKYIRPLRVNDDYVVRSWVHIGFHIILFLIMSTKKKKKKNIKDLL